MPNLHLQFAAGQIISHQKIADGLVVLHIQCKLLQALQLFVYHHLGLNQHGVLVAQVFLAQQLAGIQIIEKQCSKWQHQHGQKAGQQPVEHRSAVGTPQPDRPGSENAHEVFSFSIQDRRSGVRLTVFAQGPGQFHYVSVYQTFPA